MEYTVLPSIHLKLLWSKASKYSKIRKQLGFGGDLWFMKLFYMFKISTEKIPSVLKDV